VDLTVPKLLLMEAGVAGTVAAYLSGRPEELVEGSAAQPLALLFLANFARLVAAACVGRALAASLQREQPS
jgi:hypothetical protein